MSAAMSSAPMPGSSSDAFLFDLGGLSCIRVVYPKVQGASPQLNVAGGPQYLLTLRPARPYTLNMNFVRVGDPGGARDTLVLFISLRKSG